MRELLSTERVVLEAIITLFVKLGHEDGPLTPVVAILPTASGTL